MISNSKITIPEKDHGFIGLGDMIINHYKNIDHQAYYEFPLHNVRITLSEEESKRVFNNIVISDDPDISPIKSIAATSCGISTPRLYQKYRFEYIVFAKKLVYWYAIKHLKYDYRKAGSIFDQDRNTAKNAFDLIEDGDRYLKEEQKLWLRTFMSKLRENKLI